MTTLNDEQKAELELQALSLWQFYNRYYRKQMSEREKALLLLLEWAEECGFGYDNFPEEYERYKEDIEGMGYIEGMIYIAEREIERVGERK